MEVAADFDPRADSVSTPVLFTKTGFLASPHPTKVS
jgi:hypothetical protein